MSDGGLWQDPRNSGPATRSWFRYQDECIAFRCIPNLIETDVSRIVVEWATDYVVISKSGDTELVSVKYREANSPKWSLGELNKERVLLDLYRVWIETGGLGRYAFETNEGYTGKEAKAILFACTTRRAEEIEKACAVLSKHLSVTADQARQFLDVLDLRSEPLPRKQAITAQNRELLASVLQVLSLDARHAAECYEFILSRIGAVSTKQAPNSAERVDRLGGLLQAVATATLPRIDDHTLDLSELRRSIELKFSAHSPMAIPRQHKPPSSNTLFTGREDELALLRHLTKRHDNNLTNPVAVTGLTGTGKTWLVREFAARVPKSIKYVEISGATRAALLEGLQRLGSIEVGTPSPLASLDDESLLLVIDGVTDPAVLRNIISTPNRACVIVTATTRHLGDHFEHLELSGWQRKDSVAYIGRISGDTSDTEADRVADALYDHPLAIAQAANFCRAEGLSLNEYLERFDRNSVGVLDLGVGADYARTLYAAVRLNIEAAINHDNTSGHLLAVLSYADSQPFPEDLFRIGDKSMVAMTRWTLADYPRESTVEAKRRRLFRGSQPTSSASVPNRAVQWEIRSSLGELFRRDSAVSILHRYSLARRTPSGIVTHPLVRMVCRSLLTGDEDFWISMVLGLYGPELLTPSLDRASDRLVPHIAESVRLAEEAGLDGPAVFISNLKLANKLADLGDPEAGIVRASSAVHVARGRVLPPQYMLLALHALSSVCIGAGLYARATSIAEEMRQMTSALGDDSFRYAAVENLAQTMLQADRFEEATRLLEDLSALGIPEDEQSSERRFSFLHMKISLHLASNQLTAAETLSSELLSFAQASNDLATRRQREAIAYDVQSRIAKQAGRVGEALTLSLMALNAYQQRRPGSFDLNSINQSIAATHAALDAGEIDQAESILRPLVKLLEDEPTLAQVQRGRILATQGRLLVAGGSIDSIRAAREPLEKAIELLKPTGVTSDNAAILFHLAQSYGASGDLRRALQFATQARDIDRNIYGANHPEVLEDEIILARYYFLTGDLRAGDAALARCTAALAGKNDPAANRLKTSVATCRQFRRLSGSPFPW